MGSQCSFSRRGVAWWWRGAKRTSLAAKFWIFWRGWIRCSHKETVAVVKPWKDVGSNKSLGCVFSEKPADWTNVFKLEISSLADFYDVLLRGQFWVKNEFKVPGRIREGDVVRAKSNRVREGTGRRFQGRRKGKEKSFCFVVIQFELIFRHPCFYVVCACIEFFGEVGHFIERSGFLELCVICEKLMVYRVVSYDIGERRSVQDEENGPQYWALRYTVHELWWWRRRVIDWSGLVPIWEVWVKPLECSRLNAKNRVQAGEEKWSRVSKSAERSNKWRTEMLSLSRAERISFTIRNKTVSVLHPAR